MNAATGIAGPLPIVTTPLAEPINVVSVNIDTHGFINPSVLLAFTGIIYLPLGISVTLDFQINRSNGDSSANVGPTFTLSRQFNIPESRSFAFQFFDTGFAPDNYNYTVQLSTNSIIDITSGLTISNAALSALAVDVA